MATMTADALPTNGVKGDKTYSFKVKNATDAFFGGLVAIDSTGYLKPWAGAAGEKPLGRMQPTPDPTGQLANPLTGDTSASPVPEATVCLESEVIINVPVTGASAITDIGKTVYLNTDNINADLTLTRPTRGLPFGIVLRWLSSTRCDVRRFSFGELAAISLAGNGRQLINIGSIDCDSLTTANVRTAIPLPFRGKIVDVFAMVDVAITGASGTADLNLEIDGTNVTGGVVTVSTAAGGTKGTKLAGTAITAANTFSESSVLDVEATVGTDMTAGRVDLFIVVEPTFGV